MAMRKRSLNNTEIDAIGKKLFAASKLTASEIDRIASDPALFDGVLGRIRSETETPEKTHRPASFASGRRLVLGLAGAVLLSLGGLAIFLEQKRIGAVFTTGIQDPVERPVAARPELTPQVRFVKGFTQGRAETMNQVSEPTVFRPARLRKDRPARPHVDPSLNSPLDENNEFVAVTFTGDAGESARGGRVVRLDIPRSTLFAMGFNVSLENASPTVTADLLIGPDGVTRAVRFVE